jgi:hypothetical protein
MAFLSVPNAAGFCTALPRLGSLVQTVWSGGGHQHMVQTGNLSIAARPEVEIEDLTDRLYGNMLASDQTVWRGR